MNDVSYLEAMLKPLVEHPDDLRISRSVDELGVLVSVSVNPQDMGKIIGRQGNTAKAIRTLVRVMGMKNGSRVNMKILEPAQA